MAGNRIKGITIQIGGDTTGLDKALKNVDKTLSETQKNLSDVNRLLKLDPKNTELLAQKQRLLKEAIDETKERLQTLNKTNEQVKDGVKNYEAWKKAYDPIKKEIDETTKKISDLKTEMSDMTDVGKTDTTEFKKLQEQLEESQNQLKALKKQAKETSAEFGNPISTDQYDALQREIIETEERLKSLQKESKNMGTAFTKTLADVSNKAKNVGKSLEPVSKGAAALAGAALATVPATEELRTDLSKLDQNAREAGLGIEKVRDSFEKFNVISDEVDSSVEATSNLLQAGFTESNLQKAVENLSGAYLRFPDTLKIESLADSLQETLATNKSTGQFAELLDRLGIGADNFSAKLETMTSEAEKQNYALETLANAGLSDTYNEYLKNNEVLVESKQASYEFQESMAKLADVLVPVITRVTKLATNVLDWFNNLSPAGKNVTMIIVGLLAVLAPLLTTFGNVALGISNIIKVTQGMTFIPELITKISGVSKGLFGLISANPVIAIITGIIAVIATLYTKCEWFRNGVNAILNAIVNGIKTGVSNITNAVKTGLQGAISFIISLKSKAVGWGKDFMQGMIDGIKSKINSIVSAVKGVASKIASYLHFSRPDEGPLHYYEEWMPDFIDGLASGINKNAYKVNNAVRSLASGMQKNMDVYSNPSSANISVAAPAVTVMVGNKQFDGYIVKTATNGINSVQASMMKAKGLK